jgi:hypothetical protein
VPIWFLQSLVVIVIERLKIFQSSATRVRSVRGNHVALFPSAQCPHHTGGRIYNSLAMLTFSSRFISDNSVEVRSFVFRIWRFSRVVLSIRVSIVLYDRRASNAFDPCACCREVSVHNNNKLASTTHVLVLEDWQLEVIVC